MALENELTKGQDIEVDIEGDKNFKELRVVFPSWGPSIVLADKGKYFKKKNEGTENPEIDVIFLGSGGYGLDTKKRIVPLGNLSTQNKRYTLIHNKGKYAETQSILEQV